MKSLTRPLFLDTGSVRACAEASAGHALHLVEGNQLSLCEENQAGDKIPQRRCIYNHTGELLLAHIVNE